MAKIYYIPGFPSSGLATGGVPVFPRNLREAVPVALFARLKYLRLDAAGNSIYPITVTGVHETDQGMIDALGAQPLANDWRLDPLRAAAPLVAQITEPGYFVCHSYGGAIMLGLLKLLTDAGQLGKVQGVFFVGSPVNPLVANWSAYETLRARGPMAQLVMNVMAGAWTIANTFNPFVTAYVYEGLSITNFFKSIVGTLDVLGFLLPINSTVREVDHWTAKNGYVTQQFLDRGLARKLAISVPPTVPYWNIYSQSYLTPNGVDTESYYGDGLVIYGEMFPGPRGVLRLTDAHGPLRDSIPCHQFILAEIAGHNPVGSSSPHGTIVDAPVMPPPPVYRVTPPGRTPEIYWPVVTSPDP